MRTEKGSRNLLRKKVPGTFFVAMWPKKRARLRAIAAAVGDVRGRRSLEVSAGDPRVGEALRARGGEWTRCRGAGQVLPEDAFDAAVVCDILEHVADDRALLATAVRALRPGGRLVVAAPLRPTKALAAFALVLGLTDADFGHVRPGYSIHELRDLISAGGAAVDAQRVLGGGLDEVLELAAKAVAGHRAPGDRDWRGWRGWIARAAGAVVTALALLDRLPGMRVAATVVLCARKSDG